MFLPTSYLLSLKLIKEVNFKLMNKKFEED
jgi:hypothetical protein